MNIDGLRKDYIKSRLDENDTGSDPVAFFLHWLDDAIHSGGAEPTAMSLSTVSPAGHPTSRIVLLKGVDQGKFIFFTNYESDKGKQLRLNPNASLLFFWPDLERQVRIEGSVTETDPVESESYFNSRPYESRLSALASPQSRVVSNREELEKMVKRVSEKFISEGLSRPAYWGGFALTPNAIEFWQGRAGRLHDRIRFRRSAESRWIKERLAP
jgi:pyridoxamine 5'-phosphate oxidase